MLLPHLRRKLRPPPAVRIGRPILEGPLAQVWWIVLLRATTAIIFGALAVLWPRHTVLALIVFFGGYALLDGLAALALSAGSERLRRRWALGASGAISITAGLFALSRPHFAALMLVRVLGAWVILRGVTELFGGASVRRHAVERPRRDEAAMALSDHAGGLGRWSAQVNAAVSMLFGVALIAAPRMGALSFTWAVGGWAIAHGLLMIPYALSLRGLRTTATP